MFEAFIDAVGGEEHVALPQHIYSERRRAMTGSPPLERKENIRQRHDLVIMTKRRVHRRGWQGRSVNVVIDLNRS
jgi:hypothetical protein